MKVFNENDYSYRSRTALNKKNVAPEYLQLADMLKLLVDSDGLQVLFDEDLLSAAVKKCGIADISDKNLIMLTIIKPQIKLMCDSGHYIDDESVTEQMYVVLLKHGFSRNVITDFLYAVFFSLDKPLRLSIAEKEKLNGEEHFSYHTERHISVSNNNIEQIEAAIKESNDDAKVELGLQILNGNIEKYKGQTGYAVELLKEGMNHGSSRAARILGYNCYTDAKACRISNDYYSKAYEYLTMYGISSDKDGLSHGQARITDILNLGIYNRKMIINYIVISVLLTLSYFVPFILKIVDVCPALNASPGGCIMLFILEISVVAAGAVVRRLRPFFTQGWIVCCQLLIWLIAMLIMIP